MLEQLIEKGQQITLSINRMINQKMIRRLFRD